jgi:hypothetical protein
MPPAGFYSTPHSRIGVNTIQPATPPVWNTFGKWENFNKPIRFLRSPFSNGTSSGALWTEKLGGAQSKKPNND